MRTLLLVHGLYTYPWERIREGKSTLKKRKMKRNVLGKLTGKIATSTIVLRTHGIRGLCGTTHQSALYFADLSW